MNNEKYTCSKCNKLYSSYKSLWNHTKKFHDNLNELNNNLTELNNKKYLCKYCNRQFNFYNNRWKHQKICKSNSDFITINKTELEALKNENMELKNNKLNKSKTINNINKNINNNNGTINNVTNITINELGRESIDNLKIEDIKKLTRMNLNAFAYIIELLNFNKDLPENHNFCVTSLEGNYVNYYNNKTKKIEKMNKKDFLDNVLLVSIQKMDDLLFTLEFNMNKNFTENIKSLYYNKLLEIAGKSEKLVMDHTKSYHTSINELSYNNKDMVLDTWVNIKKSEDDDCSVKSFHSSESSDSDEEIPYKYALKDI